MSSLKERTMFEIVLPRATIAASLLSVLLVSGPAFAFSDANISLSSVGTQYNNPTSQFGYMQTTLPTSGNCGGTIYFDLTNEAGKSMLALALSARMASRAITRIDYTVASRGSCYATLLQL
jgi:hypothetical protein